MSFEIGWNEVESSMMAAVAYDIIGQALYIRFKSKGNPEWMYTPVSLEDYMLFREAESLGSFFHKHIKTNPGITAAKINA